MYGLRNPHGDRSGEFYCDFKHLRVTGIAGLGRVSPLEVRPSSTWRTPIPSSIPDERLGPNRQAVKPSSQLAFGLMIGSGADRTVLLTIAQLATGLVLAIFARVWQRHPEQSQ